MQLSHQWVVVKTNVGFVEAGEPGFSSQCPLLCSWAGELRALEQRKRERCPVRGWET